MATNGAWRATTQQQLLANGKDLLDIFNYKSARVYRVYRMWAFNNQYTAVSGVIGYLNVYRITGANGGYPIAPIPCDTLNYPISSDCTCGTNRSIALGSVFRRIPWSPEECLEYTTNWNTIMTIVAYAEIWNAGWADSHVEPLTIRSSQAEGYCIYSTTTTAGVVDAELEFTDMAS